MKIVLLILALYKFYYYYYYYYIIIIMKNKEQHPFHVKSNWVPPVQQSVALKSYLEEVKTELAEIQLLKPKHNLPHNERKAIKDLKSNHDINIKKADKGTTTVITRRHDKIKEGQIQLDDLDNYRPLEQPMVEETAKKAKQITSELYQRNHIGSMTKKWFLQTPNPPCIPVFYLHPYKDSYAKACRKADHVGL